jgi:hypothetical protein
MKEHRYPEEIKEDSFERALRLFEVERNYNGEKETDECEKSTGEMGEAAPV